ncbi:hypothetical protein ACFSTD_21615 [Novosphingobium colocasiae]
MGEMIAIPVEEYRDLRRAAEELADLRTFDQAKAAMARGEDEQVPAEIARRLIAGETPLRVWRDFRGLTQQRLSVASGVNRVQIANIEIGHGPRICGHFGQAGGCAWDRRGRSGLNGSTMP